MLAAYNVYLWRFLNVLENWIYVASKWSIEVFLLTIAPEIRCPIVHCWIEAQQ